MIVVKSGFLLQIIVMMQSTFALAFANRYARHLTTPSSLFIHHRHTIGSRLIRYSFSSTKVPVEVSPSDHGTFPITDFAGSSILDNRIIETLQSPGLNITTPTPIQSHSLPLLFQNYDVMASSATGSGKTLMFCIPILNKLLGTSSSKRISSKRIGQPSALIISPTRELSVQT
jgi:superfamily II DNA/RNA helicase